MEELKKEAEEAKQNIRNLTKTIVKGYKAQRIILSAFTEVMGERVEDIKNEIMFDQLDAQFKGRN